MKEGSGCFCAVTFVPDWHELERVGRSDFLALAIPADGAASMGDVAVRACIEDSPRGPLH